MRLVSVIAAVIDPITKLPWINTLDTGTGTTHEVWT